MGNLRPFQIIILAVFGVLALAGLIFFALFRGFGSEPNPYGTNVEIWGTLDQRAFAETRLAISDVDENFEVVQYVKKDARTFRTQLVNAIAEGRGPDAIVLPHDLLLSERAKVAPIPYETLPERTIRDTYVEGAEIFALADGVYGMPLVTDPLVMYWNRDLFATAGIAQPPATWEEVVSVATPRLTKRTPSRDILQSAVAFGEFANVTNAQEILVMLMVQSGSPLIFEEGVGQYSVFLDQSFAQTARPPASAAVDFYTQFANPSRATYSWNRALPADRQAFLSGDLALYFGFGSERTGLRAGNPNLNFDVARVPQGAGATVHKGYGTFYSLAPLRSSDNLAGTYTAIFTLSAQNNATLLAQQLGMAPVHRAVLAGGAPDAQTQSLFDSALVARGWLNPDPEDSERVFQILVDDVNAGRVNIGEAINDAVVRLRQLLPS